MNHDSVVKTCSICGASWTAPVLNCPREDSHTPVDSSTAALDPLDGAIERLPDSVRGDREVSLALNEAFRNGLRQGRAEESETELEEVKVHVPGVPYESADGLTGACDWPASIVTPRDPHDKCTAYALPEHFPTAALAALRQNVSVADFEPKMVAVNITGLPRHSDADTVDTYSWSATREVGQYAHGGSLPVYHVQGDVNSVAVGRFKASLRKFLGIS